MIKEKINKILKNKIFIVFVAIIFPFFIELVKFKKIEFELQTIIRIGFMYGIYALIGIYLILKKHSKKLDKIASFLIKYRYVIAGIMLVITVFLKINLSSVGMWSSYVNDKNSNNVLLGVARGIRSDDWLVQTPMMLAQTQGEDAYKIYNKNIAQGNCNMLMVSAPVKDIVSIGKPFMWGFILFGQEYGYSFYWMAKIIAIIMVSIELILKLTKKDNLLSLVGGLVLALAPAMMWWFSSAIADGYIFGVATIILFDQYMNGLDKKTWKKILIAIGLFITLPSFAFVLYPAFQIPFAFLMAIFMLNDFIPNVKKLTKKDYIIIIITILGIVGLILRYLLLCMPDMITMMSTVYPGNRISVGGDFSLDRFISYFANMFYPYSKSVGNACEPSSYIYSFIGLIILIIYSFKNLKVEKKDINFKITVSLIILYVIFLIWEFVGFGETLAKLTFMSMSPTPRSHVILGIIGTLLTIIMIKKVENKKLFTLFQSMLISICIVFVAYVLIKNSSYATYFNFTKLEIFIFMMFAISYFLITGNKKAWCYTMLIVSIVAGATINPICIGLSPIQETTIAKELQKIKEDDEEAIWIGNSNITGQYLMANGINCLNGVNSYPNFKWLSIVDPEEKYNEVYNRYAHIHIKLGKETNFELLAADAYQATLTYQNLIDLDIKYIYSSEKYTNDIIDIFNLEEKYINDDISQYIYKINY